MTYIAELLSRRQLRQLALQIWKTIGYENIPWFPVVFFLENIMSILFPGFMYEIVQESELGKSRHGDTDIVNKCIRIRKDIYYGTVESNGRDRMTVAHEIVHYILLVVCGANLQGHFLVQGTYFSPVYEFPLVKRTDFKPIEGYSI